MLTLKCYPMDYPDAQWLYCPSFAAAVLFASLFGLTSICHCIQGYVSKHKFALIGITGAIWECCGYIFRTLSTTDQLNPAYFDLQQLLILLAPLWINAYVYVVFGRLARACLQNDSIFGLKTRTIIIFFIICDIMAFGIQAGGATTAIIADSSAMLWLGIHVYMAGIACQIFFVLIFGIFGIRLQRLLKNKPFPPVDGDNITRPIHMPVLPSSRQALKLLSGVLFALTLIVFRNAYRIVEFSNGSLSTYTLHEWYTFVFDSTPMLFTLLTFNVFHPGSIIQGKGLEV